mgnify:CR=1 FL=1
MKLTVVDNGTRSALYLDGEMHKSCVKERTPSNVASFLMDDSVDVTEYERVTVAEIGSFPDSLEGLETGKKAA